MMDAEQVGITFIVVLIVGAIFMLGFGAGYNSIKYDTVKGDSLEKCQMKNDVAVCKWHTVPSFQ